MSKAERLSHETADITDENIEKIGALFPNCLTEAKDEQGRLRRAIDFDKLRQELSHEVVEGADERYRFDWPEKRKATLLANTPTKMTLRPCREESVNFDTTQNLYIEGDNLEVLKLLRENYYKQVKMIYIDPPYNTGKDSFVYDDDFRKSTEGFADESDATDEEGNKMFDLRQNNESNGRFHTDWLNMMYPRLKVAKDLLRDDGVIFISIDDNEVENLRRICDEIFGEKNFVAQLVWKSKSGGANDARFMAIDHEYILCYVRAAEFASFLLDTGATVTTSYNRKDEKGSYSLDRLDKQSLGYQESLDFPIEGPDGKIYYVEHKNPLQKVARWRWGKDTVKARYDELVFENGHVYTKNYEKEGAIPRSLLIEDRFGRTRTGKTENVSLMGREVFTNPKPSKLMAYLCMLSAPSDSIVIDFFSGSATTAHAVMKLNAEDGGKRKFIMVQLRETCPEKSEAAKAGYKNICEIGKERIRRAGKKILEEWNETLVVENTKAKHEGESLSLPGLDANGETIEINVGAHMANKQTPPDVGFRVLKLDSSNMKDVYYNPKEFEEEFVFHDSDASLAENIKTDRTGEDLLFDTMLRLGIPLSAKIAAEEIHGKKVFTVDDGLLMATFDKDLNEEAIAAIAKRKPVYFAMSDGGFATDNVADNFEQIWQEFSPDTKRKVI